MVKIWIDMVMIWTGMVVVMVVVEAMVQEHATVQELANTAMVDWSGLEHVAVMLLIMVAMVVVEEVLALVEASEIDQVLIPGPMPTMIDTSYAQFIGSWGRSTGGCFLCCIAC
jgi:hypothetical protein